MLNNAKYLNGREPPKLQKLVRQLPLCHQEGKGLSRCFMNC